MEHSQIDRLIARNAAAGVSAAIKKPPQKTRDRGAQIAAQLVLAVAAREKKQRGSTGKNAKEILGEIGGAEDDNQDQGEISNKDQPGGNFEASPSPAGEDGDREIAEVKSLKYPVLDNILRAIEGK